ncbi:PREDICTED: neural/ectodermal development factor IMP-L2 isoform X2 [Nicrophorus vespilloides]|uniref:Neural/ectodermal development factor IMP-L2 isoform X2 n=1 Tax=Nicrophorus vespilloides TaxID=110193 RepID=A0ABM1M968_NICVS|nr:PREDICTED: neural/ectodermal development factor IMP-L2 isoform X2 [Nicrophorus vespilloides]
MKVYAFVLLALYLQATESRRLSDQMDNEIERSNGNRIDFGKRVKDWVRISEAPSPVISYPADSRIQLECEAIGSPAPTIQWLKGNTFLTDNNLIDDVPPHGMAKIRARLVINSALPIHEGTFTCVAESGAQVATAKSNVYVVRNENSERNITELLTKELLETRAKPTIVLFDTIYMDNIGSDIVLPCKAVGNPRPNIMWFDPTDNRIRASNDRVTVLPDGGLRIRNIHWSDMGKYVCVAMNADSQDNISTFLYPMRKSKASSPTDAA